MNNIEDLLYRVFYALLKSYGKIEGCELFRELLNYVNFDENYKSLQIFTKTHHF